MANKIILSILSTVIFIVEILTEYGYAMNFYLKEDIKKLHFVFKIIIGLIKNE